MSDNSINLAALWVPVMAETSQLKGQLAAAGTEGKIAFERSFSGAFSNVSRDLSNQLRTGLSMAMAEMSPGMGMLSNSLIRGFDGVRGKAQQAEASLGNLSRAEDRLSDAIARQAIAQKRLNELQGKGVADNSAQMMTAAAAAESANRKVVRATEEQAAAERLRASAMTGSTASMMAFTASTGALVAAGAAIGVSAKAAGDFQQAMMKLQASASVPAAQVKVLGDGILAMTGQVGYSADALGGAMYTITKSLDGAIPPAQRSAQALMILKAAAQGANAEQAPLNEVVQALTTTLQDFHVPADQAATVMSKMVTAVGESKVPLQEFAGALHSIEPQAAAAHLKLEDVWGVLAQITQSGTSADQAADQMNNAMRSLSGANAPATAAMQQLGINADEVSQRLSERGLAGTMQYLSDTVMQHFAGQNKIAVGEMRNAAQAASNAKEMIGQMGPAAQTASQALMNGQMGSRQYTMAMRGATEADKVKMEQFRKLIDITDGFSKRFANGRETLETYNQVMNEITGTQSGAAIAFQITGEHAQETNDRIHKITDTMTESDGTVKGFNESQSTLNAKMRDAKEAFGAAAIQLGSAFLPELTAVAGALRDTARFLEENKGLTEGLTVAVGGLAGGYLLLKGALGFKHLIDDLRTSFFGLNAAAVATNETLVAAGPAAAAGAAGVEAAAAAEVTAEEGVTVAAGGARAALAGIAAVAGPVAAATVVADQVSDAGMHSDNRFVHGISDAFRHNPLSAYGLFNIATGRHAAGGPLDAPGPKGTDSALFWGAKGEHVLTDKDVDAMGGHPGVYAFRNALHRAGGGAVGDDSGPVSRLYREARTLNGGSYNWGSTDCSGAVSMLVDAALGTSGRMSTATASQWLSAKGFQPGMGGPGSLSIGWYNGGPGGGHMAATLPDGTHFESGGQHGNIMLGGSAAGAETSEFTNHMHLPLNGFYPDGPAGSMGGGMMGALGGGGAGGFGGMGGGSIPAGSTAGTGPGGQSGYYTPSPEKAAAAEERLRHLDAEIATAEQRKSELKGTAKQSERDRLDEEIRHLHEERTQAQEKLTEAQHGTFHASKGGKGGGSGGGSGGANSAAESLGGSFLQGLLGDFGFGNVLGGKSPLDWGIVKVAEGLGQWGMGLLQDGLGSGGLGDMGDMASGLGGTPDMGAFGGAGPSGGSGGGAFSPGAGGGPGGGAAGGATAGPSGGARGRSGWPQALNPPSPGAPDGSSGLGRFAEELLRRRQGLPAGAPRPRLDVPRVDYPGQADIPPELRMWAIQNGMVDASGRYIGPAFPSTPPAGVPIMTVPQGQFPGDSGSYPVPAWQRALNPNRPSGAPTGGGPGAGINPGAVQRHATGGFISGNVDWNGTGTGPSGTSGTPPVPGDWGPSTKWGPNGAPGDDPKWLTESPWPGWPGPPFVPGDPWRQNRKNVSGFSSGGPSGTDTVPAWLSPGEFVMNKSAVNRYGSVFMSSVNAGKFASGGVVPLTPSAVGAAMASTAIHPQTYEGGGGNVTHGATFNIQQQGMFLDQPQATDQIRQAAYTGTAWHNSMTSPAIMA